MFLKFFPYFANGKPNRFEKIYYKEIDKFPTEICSAPFTWVVEGNGLTISNMEFIAGFVGLKQDHETMALRPEIGWMVGEAKESPKISLPFGKAGKHIGISLNLKDEIPKDLYDIQPKVLGNLSLSFTGNVHIPTKLLKIRISHLSIRGEISEKEKKRIIRMFQNPMTRITINDEEYKPSYANYDNEMVIIPFFIFKFCVWQIQRFIWLLFSK